MLFTAVVLGMGSGRHIYRQAALAGYPAEIRPLTETYAAALNAFNQKHSSEPAPAEPDAE